jgi:hypothetical protein
MFSVGVPEAAKVVCSTSLYVQHLALVDQPLFLCRRIQITLEQMGLINYWPAHEEGEAKIS